MSKEQKGYECTCSWSPCHHSHIEKRQSDFDRVTAERDAAISELSELKAAQPQDEPVAIVVEQTQNYGNFLIFGSTIPGVHRPVPVVERKAHLLDQSLPTGTKLYAEQPARPVAAKHTMWSIMEAVERSSEYTVLTSNQCAALAAALNHSRPTHASPPPGTEPSGTHHDNDGLDEWRKPK